MQNPLSDETKKRKWRPQLHLIIISSVIAAIIGLTIMTILIIKSQGLTQGVVTLTIVSILTGMIIGLLGLMLNSFQWLSSRSSYEHHPPVDAGHLLSSVVPSQQASTPVQPTSSHPFTPHSQEQASGDLDAIEFAGVGLHQEDWGDAPDTGSFYGRESECAELERWIIQDHCRLVALLGIGGIGKTALTTKLAEQIKNQFDYIFWRSLQNAPPLESILKSCIQLLSNHQRIDLPENLDDQMALLIQYLRERRCLLVLDNVETIMQAADPASHYREGYAPYGKLIQSVGEGKHQSCLILTSREKPREIVQLEGKTAPVRSLLLHGLDRAEGQDLLKDRGLLGSDETLTTMINIYSGNPLALKLASGTIQDVFEGDVASFLRRGRAVFGDIRDPLDLQFTRLSEREREMMYWLAIEREAVSLDDLREDTIDSVSEKDLFVVFGSLRRRSMIESSGDARFILQPVILEYVTDIFVELVSEEIEKGIARLLKSHALIKAQTKDYVRDAQVRLILKSVAEPLLQTLGKEGLANKLNSMLVMLREAKAQKTGYAAGNILNMLAHLQVDLRGYDFSYLTLLQAYLQGVVLTDVNFAHATIERSIFTEPFGSILSVALSPNGELLAAAGSTGEIRLWDLKGSTLVSTCQGHDGYIYSVAFGPDGQTVASGSEDRTVRLWNAGTGQSLAVLRGHTDRIWRVAFSHDGKLLASGSHDGRIKLWEVSTGQCLATLEGHAYRVWPVAFSPDDKLLASGSHDGKIKLWEVSTSQCVLVLEGHSLWSKSITFSPDGKLLASGSEDRTVRLWDVKTGECLKILRGHAHLIESVAFSPDGALLASGSDDQTVRLWDVKTGQNKKTLQEHANWVSSVAFGPDGKWLASGSYDQTVKLWDVETGQCFKTLRGYTHLVESVAFSPDGVLLASGSNDRAVRLWNIETGQCLKTLYGHSGWVRSVAVHPQGRTVASGSDDQTIRLWNIETGQCIATLKDHTSRVWAIAFNPEGTVLASGSEDCTVRLYEVGTGRSLMVLQGHDGWIYSLAFSPDGETLVSGAGDRSMRWWEVKTARLLKVFEHPDRVWAVAFSPDGKLLASGSEDHTVRLWEVNSDRSFILPGHTNIVRSIDFSPDGSMLISGSNDHTIRLWEVSTRLTLATFYGHTNQVRAVTFNANGNLLASSSQDSTIKLWDIHTRACLQTLRSDRPYERMNITQVSGLTDAQKLMLKALGAIETGW